jgi:transcriptional regulator with GAF, ATPase, and Fis domain
MAGAYRKTETTLDHVEPKEPKSESHQPVLLVVYPRRAVLPLPESETRVGRVWLADHGLRDGEVSSQHIGFVRRGGVSWVEDVGSKNGTWVDGERLAPNDKVPLRDGAVLRIGRTLMVHRNRLQGLQDPAAPIGDMVGPFGLRSVAAAIEAVQRHPPANVLIVGETGTGKELAARAIAGAGGRSEPYAAVNVAAVPAGVFESQLFGHVAGAFSDARSEAAGILQAHDGGAVLLDEIGDLPLELQPKLLRLLENGEVLPVGADRPIRVNVMLLAATNHDLEELVRQRRFRGDLYARLNLARVQLPPLRDRAEDIYAIAGVVAAAVGASIDPSEVEAVERLLLHPWPGNVRGLIAMLARMAALEPEGGLRLWAIEKLLGREPDTDQAPLTWPNVQAVLSRCDGNESRAARRLGISRGKLRRFLKKRQQSDGCTESDAG